MSSEDLWENYVEENDVQLADDISVADLIERYPISGYGAVDRLVKNALIHVPYDRQHFELADFDAAFEEIDFPEPISSNQEIDDVSEASSRQIESDGGHTVVTPDNDPIDDQVGIEIDEQQEIEELLQFNGGGQQ